MIFKMTCVHETDSGCKFVCVNNLPEDYQGYKDVFLSRSFNICLCQLKGKKALLTYLFIYSFN